MPTAQLLRQIITVQVTAKGRRPGAALRQALADSGDVASYEIRETGDVEAVPGVNRERLIGLAVWAAGEDAKQRLGLPSEWDQSDWLRRNTQLSCGTACCIAGKVAIDDGGVPLRVEVGDWATLSDGYTSALIRINGVDRAVDDYARETLGLSYEQASELFAASNKLEDVLRTVGKLIGEDVEPPTRRRLRPGREAMDCSNQSCDSCYETVPAEEPETVDF